MVIRSGALMRVVVLIAALTLGLVPLLVHPVAHHSPYLSALADAAAPPAYAARCTNRVCDFTDPTMPTCIDQAHSKSNCRIRIIHNEVTCTQTAC